MLLQFLTRIQYYNFKSAQGKYVPLLLCFFPPLTSLCFPSVLCCSNDNSLLHYCVRQKMFCCFQSFIVCHCPFFLLCPFHWKPEQLILEKHLQFYIWEEDIIYKETDTWFCYFCMHYTNSPTQTHQSLQMNFSTWATAIALFCTIFFSETLVDADNGGYSNRCHSCSITHLLCFHVFPSHHNLFVQYVFLSSFPAPIVLFLVSIFVTLLPNDKSYKTLYHSLTVTLTFLVWCLLKVLSETVWGKKRKTSWSGICISFTVFVISLQRTSAISHTDHPHAQISDL